MRLASSLLAWHIVACTVPPPRSTTPVIADADTTSGDVASASARFTYRHGVRVEHWLAHVAPMYEGRSGIAHTFAAAWFDREDLGWIAGHGFDHIVVPASAEELLDPGGATVAAALAPLDRTIAEANALGLGVVLELLGSAPRVGVPPRYEPDEDLDPADPEEQRRRAAAWGRIALHFADVGEGLRFAHAEALLPPTPDPNPRLQAYVGAIRAADPERFVYVMPPVRERSAGEAGFLLAPPGATIEHLGALDLDALGPRVGVKFTFYEPESFVFQDPSHGAVPLPASTAADIDAAFARVARWRATSAPEREVYLGDFGLTEGIDPSATAAYLQAITGAARRHDLGWAIYDYESGRAVRGEDGGPTAIGRGLDLDGTP